MASALDGACDLTLVLCAGTRLTAWAYLALVGDEALKQADILIVDHDFFIGAKLALARAGVEASASKPAPTWPAAPVSRT
jgi:hypothetical protein